MSYGIITLAAVSCRAEASHKSEQINQLLFGDLYTVLEEAPDWYKIQCAYDGYIGWIHKKHHSPVSSLEFRKLQKNPSSVVLDLLATVNDKLHHTTIHVPIGSTIYPVAGFSYKGKKSSPKHSNIYKYSMLYLNAPYLWGGKTPFGIDCSGFIQMSHKLCGIKLPRDSWQQALTGKKVAKLSAAQKGDLCFFGDGEKVTHVGLLLSNGRIIHASGKVRIDRIDEKGVFNEELQEYTHKLKSIRRIR